MPKPILYDIRLCGHEIVDTPCHECVLQTEREKVRVLRDALIKAVAEYAKEARHLAATTGQYRCTPAWVVPARQALLATTEEPKP